MPVQIFDRADPHRNRSQSKWFEQIREDHMKLSPGKPGMPMRTDEDRLAAGCHEIKLPPRGIAQLCKNCRKATRESLWVVRCGPCGEYFSPLLRLFNACEHCGWAEGAMEQLRSHQEMEHEPPHR